MARLLVFGPGYSATRLMNRLRGDGWHVIGASRDGLPGSIPFDDEALIGAAIRASTHILSSVPPFEDRDPVLARYQGLLYGADAWLGYLSSSGVYGDTGGAWADESAPLSGRRGARVAADTAWRALGARIFRLPGIYGPGRSPLDRVVNGRARRVLAPNQMFSRIHVDDIARGVIAGFAAPPGAYNLADDMPAAQNDVVTFAAGLLGRPPPPFVALDDLPPEAAAFYAENRRIANGKAKRVLGWSPLYPDYRAGLRALSATISPSPANAAPAPASNVQR